MTFNIQTAIKTNLFNEVVSLTLLLKNTQITFQIL